MLYILCNAIDVSNRKQYTKKRKGKYIRYLLTLIAPLGYSVAITKNMKSLIKEFEPPPHEFDWLRL